MLSFRTVCFRLKQALIQQLNFYSANIDGKRKIKCIDQVITVLTRTETFAKQPTFAKLLRGLK